MNKTTVLRIALLVLAVLVWGNALYRYFFGSTEDEEFADLAPIESILSQDSTLIYYSSDSLFVYKAAFSDPFYPSFYVPLKKPKPKPVQKTKPKPPPKPRPRPPTLRFTGMIGGGESPLAFIQDRNGTVFHAHINDTITGAIVRFIKEDSLGYEFNGEMFWIECR